jgi:hypothetical protein
MLADNLKRISVRVHLEKQKEIYGNCQLTFIYGISKNGLCPFEVRLHQKGVGDSLQITVSKNNAQELFGHLYPLLCSQLKWPDSEEDLQLQVSVSAIETVEDREIVQALAKNVGHGCGGTCDCGCS